jgi:hypothetical protein
MTRITAAEARELAGPIVQERVEAVYPLIREAAEKKQRRLALHSAFWVNGGYSESKEWKEACELLRKDGFTVSFFYYEERQFVDMYTIVEW